MASAAGDDSTMGGVIAPAVDTGGVRSTSDFTVSPGRISRTDIARTFVHLVKKHISRK